MKKSFPLSFAPGQAGCYVLWNWLQSILVCNDDVQGIKRTRLILFLIYLKYYTCVIVSYVSWSVPPPSFWNILMYHWPHRCHDHLTGLQLWSFSEDVVHGGQHKEGGPRPGSPRKLPIEVLQVLLLLMIARRLTRCWSTCPSTPPTPSTGTSP